MMRDLYLGWRGEADGPEAGERVLLEIITDSGDRRQHEHLRDLHRRWLVGQPINTASISAVSEGACPVCLGPLDRGFGLGLHCAPCGLSMRLRTVEAGKGG